MGSNVFSTACEFGYCYHMLDYGEEINGVWCSCFAKTREHGYPRLMIGYDHKARKYVTEVREG